MSERKHWKKLISDFIGILVGTAIMAAGLNLFLIPSRLAAGGVSGLGIILFHVIGIPVGLTILLANIPLFLIAYLIMGKKVTAQSFMGMLLLSIWTEALVFLPVFKGDLLLSSIYGGVFLGIGLWMVFHFRGSTGGTALASLLLNRLMGITLGQGLLGSDIMIIIFAGLVFGLEIAMYATISLFVSSWVIDVIQEGFSLAKVALIITTQRKKITERIFEEINRGVTFMSGEGGYTGKSREMLFCVVTRPQVSHLKRVVYEADPGAFMIIGNAGETIGEGFRKQEIESRKQKAVYRKKE